MKNRKTTRRALFSSVISLILCCAMLVGTTFAWFTDEVTSGVNTIAAGNLDVELYHDKANEFTDLEKSKVDENTLLFTDANGKEIDHWEPGVVAFTNLKVANVGSLALKYQLSVNSTETNYVEVDGVQYTLADALQIAVVPEGVTGTREEVIAAVDEWEPMKSFTLPGVLEGETTSQTYGIVVYWQPGDSEADNLFNMNNGKKTNDENPLNITLGVNLFATQEMYEDDSFGPDYDEDATLCKFIVTNEAELVAALAEAKDGDVIGIKGTGVTWTTGAGIGSTPFIENASTFALREQAVSTTQITLVGLTDDATFTAIGAGVGAIGIDNGTVTFRNLKIVDESVSYAENNWEFGYLEFRGNTVFENCNIVNAIMMDGDSASFENCTFNSNKDNEYAVWVSNGSATFEGCTFTGARGLKLHEAYGSEIGTVVVNNNKFIDLTKKPGMAFGDLNADTTVVVTNNTFAGTQAGDQGLYSYETDTDVTTFNFTYTDNIVAGYADTNDGLKDQLQNNAIVVLPEGAYTLPSMGDKEGVTIIGAADGSTVIGGESATTGYASNFGKNTSIQNVTFSGSENGVRWSYANGGTSTFDNCTFAGDSVYGFHMDESKGATLIFNNCTFSGFNAFAGDLVKVVFNNCTFLHNGNYGHTNIWSTAEFNNCTWGDKASVGTGDNAHLFFDGVEESYYHEYVGSAASLLAFADSVNKDGDSWSGQKVSLVADIDLENAAWTPIGQTGATEFKGIFDGQNYTIKNLNVDSSAQTGKHYSSGLFGWVEGKVTIKNVKIDGAKIVGNHNVAALVGYTYSGRFTNCHVTNAEIICTHANDDACGDKCGLIVGYAGNESRITDCSASDSTVKAGRDGGQLIGAGYNVSVKNCTATNVTVTAGGDCNGKNVNEAIIGRVLG